MLPGIFSSTMLANAWSWALPCRLSLQCVIGTEVCASWHRGRHMLHCHCQVPKSHRYFLFACHPGPVFIWRRILYSVSMGCGSDLEHGGRTSGAREWIRHLLDFSEYLCVFTPLLLFSPAFIYLPDTGCQDFYAHATLFVLVLIMIRKFVSHFQGTSSFMTYPHGFLTGISSPIHPN